MAFLFIFGFEFRNACSMYRLMRLFYRVSINVSISLVLPFIHLGLCICIVHSLGKVKGPPFGLQGTFWGAMEQYGSRGAV